MCRCFLLVTRIIFCYWAIYDCYTFQKWMGSNPSSLINIRHLSGCTFFDWWANSSDWEVVQSDIWKVILRQLAVFVHEQRSFGCTDHLSSWLGILWICFSRDQASIRTLRAPGIRWRLDKDSRSFPSQLKIHTFYCSHVGISSYVLP